MTETRTIKFLQRLLLFSMAVIFLAQFSFSLYWRQFLDTPLLNYTGFLINEHERIPYKEIFETSMPGTLLFHSILGKTLGYSDFSVRIADSFFLLSAMLLIFLILKAFHLRQALFAALLFGLTHLSFGSKMALQRDFIGATAILGAVYLAMLAGNRTKTKAFLLQFSSGILIGTAAAFKPHLAICLPFLAWHLKHYEQLFKSFFKHLVILSCGAILSFSIPMVWLWHLGGLPEFVDIFTNYLPLHTQIGHDFTLVQWPEKLWYAIGGLFIMNDHLLLTVLALAGIFFGLKESESHRQNQVKLLITCFFLYFVYPAISGQFWFYHWTPFFIFAAISASFMLCPSGFGSPIEQAVRILALTILLPLAVGWSTEFSLQIRGLPLDPPLSGVPDQIASFLKKNLQPGQTVQPLDWVNGAIHGLLIAKVPISTRFLYDYHFTHHLSRPYIKNLRLEFLKALQHSPPDYIIFVFVKSRVSGPDTAQDFPELGKFIFSNYKMIEKTQNFGIFRKITESAR